MVYQCIAPNSPALFYRHWQPNPKGRNYNFYFPYSFSNYDSVHISLEQLKILTQLKSYLPKTFKYENDNFFICIYDDLPLYIMFIYFSTSNFSVIKDRLIKAPHNINLKLSINATTINLDDFKKWTVLFNIHPIISNIGLDFFITNLNQLIDNKFVKQKTTAHNFFALSLENFGIGHEKQRNDDINHTQKIDSIFNEINLVTSSDNEDNFLYKHITDPFLQQRNATILNQLSIN